MDTSRKSSSQFLSALLSRINKPSEFKHEVAQAGAGAKGEDRREDGLPQVVTIQNAVGTNFRSENGGNSDRSIFNSKVSNIVLKGVVFLYRQNDRKCCVSVD